MIKEQINVNCTGIVKSFDKENMTADVEPLIRKGGKKYPVLKNLRVAHYSGHGYFIRPILRENDKVFLFISQGYLEDALETDRAEEENFLKFNLSNAVIYPNVTKEVYNTYSEEGLLIGTENAYIQFLEDSIKIKIGDHEVVMDSTGLSSNESITVGDISLTGHTHATAALGTPSVPIPFPAPTPPTP